MRITLPTVLTLARMVASVPIAVTATIGATGLTAALLIFSAITDYLDGALARGRGEVTKLGAALDPIADKLITTAALCGYLASGTISGSDIAPAISILLRETLIAGLRESVGATGGGLPVTRLAKIKTALQFLTLLLLAFGSSVYASFSLWATAAITLFTGAQYLLKWRAIVR